MNDKLLTGFFNKGVISKFGRSEFLEFLELEIKSKWVEM